MSRCSRSSRSLVCILIMRGLIGGRFYTNFIREAIAPPYSKLGSGERRWRSGRSYDFLRRIRP